MKRIEVKGLPANITAYELTDGSIYRIHMDMITPVDQLSTASDVEVETRGYLIDKDGSLLIDENLEPITLPRQRARIPLANVRAGADTMKPGWVKQNLPEDEAQRAAALEGVKKLKNLPKTGEPGDTAHVGDELFVYGEGLYDSVRRGRLADLDVAPTRPQDMDIQNLLP